MPLSVNSRLNQRYKILEVIAIGGMGSIYRALDESLNIEVALKENLFSSNESTRQFHYEAKILANLKHPNLPRVTDHFSIPNQGQYLVMDFIYGEDLKDRIEKHGVLNEKEARLIGVAICDALTYLHHQDPQIIHRDIKPGNIKISPSGDVFLVDFGLAKQAKPEQETTTGAQALTPGYAPPEQYGQGTVPRSDIYSLGATLYAAVTSEIPVDALARTIGSGELLPIQSLNKTISDNFTKCIEKAMAIDLNHRYENAEDFKNALLSSPELTQTDRDAKKIKIAPLNFNELPTRAISNHAQNGANEQTRSRSKRTNNTIPSKTNLPLVFIIFILLGIISAGIWIGYRVLNNQPQNTNLEQTIPTQVEAEQNTPDANTVVQIISTSTNHAIDSTLSPELATTEQESNLINTSLEPATGGGSGRIAFASDRTGLPQIWTMKSDGSEPTQITNLTDGACYPDWSPDGTQLVITSPCRDKQEFYKGSALFIINADGSGLRPIISVPGGDFNAVWSPDGNKLLFASLRENINVPHIYEIDLANGQTVTRLSSGSSFDRNACWSPDGTQIAFESSRLGVPQIWIMNADGSEPKEFSNQDIGAGYMPDWSPHGEILIFSLGSTRGLFAKQVQNRTLPEVEVTSLRPVRDPAYSPDSYWIAFESLENEYKDIFIVTINGSNLVNLTQDEANDFHPVWQP